MSDTPEGKKNPQSNTKETFLKKTCSETAGFKARKITVNPRHKAYAQYKQSQTPGYED